MNEDREHVADQQTIGDSQPCCSGGDCCPPASGSGGKWRIVVFVAILVAAGVVLARSLLNKSDSSAGQEEQAFAAIQPAIGSDSPSSAGTVTEANKPAATRDDAENAANPGIMTGQDVPVKAVSVLWGPELDSFASLNKAAVNSNGVFLLLAADDEQANQSIVTQIEAAAKKIEAGGMHVSAFRLKKGTQNYAQVATQFSVPCVLAMVKGAGASSVSGEITETKLIQAFVAASRPSGCCPTGGPCGPAK